jgi:hypothetical protein
VAIVPVTPGLRRGFPVPGFRLSEVLIGAAAVAVLLPARPNRYRSWRALELAAMAYVVGTLALGTFDMLLRGDAFSGELLGKLFGPLQFFLLYRVVVVALDTDERRRLAMRVLLLASLPMAAVAVLQQLDIGPTRSIIVSLTDGQALQGYSYRHLARATGLFAAWHSLAGYLAVIIVLGVALLLQRHQRVLAPRTIAVVVVSASIALVGTLTLIAMLGALGACLLLGYREGYLSRVLGWLVIVVVTGVVLFAPFLSERYQDQFDATPLHSPAAQTDSFVPQTVRYRVRVWKNQYLPAMAGRYLTGYGPGVPPEVTWQFTESLYITLLLRGGIPLLAAFLALMVVVLAQCRALERSPSAERRAVAQALGAIVIVLFFMHVLNPYFTDAGLPHQFWILMGIVAGMRRDPDEVGRATREVSRPSATPAFR